MHLLVDISAHGLGHLAQSAPVVEALQARRLGLRLTVRSALPRSSLDRCIATGFEHVRAARDFGFVMHNAVDIDLTASAKAYREFHQNWPERVCLEAGWLRENRVDAVLTNVAYLPLAAAARAGVPAASLCSINWADLFIHYFAAEPWAAKIYAEMQSAYRDARCFLRVSPGLPMTSFERRRNIGPIVRLGRRDRLEVSRRLGMSEGTRWILVAMGGMDFRLPVETWRRVPGFTWLVPNAWQVQREDVRYFDNAAIDYADIIASVDAVITKPGYATFVEAAFNRIPIIYMQREDWPETLYLTAWLAAHARSCAVSRSRLMQGEFIDQMSRLWGDRVPAIPLATGVDEAVHLLRTELGLH